MAILDSVNSSKLFLLFLFVEIFIFAYFIKEAYISIFIIIIEIVIFTILRDSDCSRNIEDGLSPSTLNRNSRSQVIDLTYNNISDEEKDAFDFCSICLEEEKESIVKLNCDHLFHKDCIKDWLKRELSCPVCRSNISLV